MIKTYFKDLWGRIKKLHAIWKILIVLFIMIEIFFVAVSFIRTDYILYTPGSLENAHTQVSIFNTDDNSNNLTNPGNIFTVSVFSYDEVSLLQYWVAKSDNKLLLENKEENVLNTEEENMRSIVLKKVSLMNSVRYAYTKANKIDSSISLNERYKGVIVSAIIDNKDTDLKPNDVITEVEGIRITSLEHFKEVLNSLLGVSKFENDYISLKASTAETTVEGEKSIKIIKDGDRLLLGIIGHDYYTLNGDNSNPKFKINYNPITDPSGNSGGAMHTLSIYNRLLEKDITYGAAICGTGTINPDGTIGAIGGIEQKVTKAYLSNAEIFFVGAPNYDEAIKACELYGYDSSFIKRVETFDDILKVLEEYNLSKGGENS